MAVRMYLALCLLAIFGGIQTEDCLTCMEMKLKGNEEVAKVFESSMSGLGQVSCSNPTKTPCPANMGGIATNLTCKHFKIDTGIDMSGVSVDMTTEVKACMPNNMTCAVMKSEVMKSFGETPGMKYTVKCSGGMALFSGFAVTFLLLATLLMQM